jgi:drug/metabolite transporter (DMT)-like permease
MHQAQSGDHGRPARWKLVLAFAAIYITWGTTYLAIREGVHTLPPALFGGVRIFCAGFLLFIFLAIGRHSLRIPLCELGTNAIVGMLMFVGGNGLITFGEMTVPSGMASLLVATTPMWMALLELLLPHGSRLRTVGWLGLLLGLGGVLVLLGPGLQASSDLFADGGPFMVLGSSACWSIGSVLARYQPRSASHLAAASWQMLVGGTCMTIFGFCRGEIDLLTPECFTPVAIYSFFHLLVFGSLVGFITYNWLLGHVSAAAAGTYAYVNPLIAVIIGWALASEQPTISLALGMVIILTGVALVRLGAVSSRSTTPAAVAWEPSAAVCEPEQCS